MCRRRSRVSRRNNDAELFGASSGIGNGPTLGTAVRRGTEVITACFTGLAAWRNRRASLDVLQQPCAGKGSGQHDQWPHSKLQNPTAWLRTCVTHDGRVHPRARGGPQRNMIPVVVASRLRLFSRAEQCCTADNADNTITKCDVPDDELRIDRTCLRFGPLVICKLTPQ